MDSFEWHTAKLVKNQALSTMACLGRYVNDTHRYMDLIGFKTQQPLLSSW